MERKTTAKLIKLMKEVDWTFCDEKGTSFYNKKNKLLFTVSGRQVFHDAEGQYFATLSGEPI